MDILRGLISYAISTVTGKPRPLSVNGSDELIVSIGGGTGAVSVQGTDADGDVATASNPLKVGAVAEELPAGTGIVDGDQVHLITDLLRRLWIRSAAFDTATNSNQNTFINTDATDHDIDYELIADETNIAVGTHYLPNSNGEKFEERNIIGWIIGLRDGDVDIEVSNDRTNWVDVTAMLIDHNTNSAATITEPDAATVYFGVSYSDDCPFQYYRFKFVPGDATSVLDIQSYSRAI